jgi:hypothetical protein
VWLSDPGDELWAHLTRWRGARALSEATLAAAVRPDRTPAERAAIGAFCARHGLAPDDQIQRALFFALTGQAGQERALDPDGSLLATAYRAAEPPTRAALRQAMAGAGHLDLARVVGSAGRATPMTAEESDYLVRELAGRRDWPALWRLVQDLPLASAAMAVRRFDAGWRPASDAGRAFFDRLASVPPDAIGGARGALARTGTIYMDVPGWACAGSFSPDGRRLVVIVSLDRKRGRPNCEACVFELPSGRMIEHYDADFDGSGPVVHVGDAFVVKTSSGKLVRSSRGFSQPLRRPVGYIAALAQYGSGFAALRTETADDGYLSRVLICDRLGEVKRSVTSDGGFDSGPIWLAVEPGTGRLALGRARHFCVLDPSAHRVIASPPRITGVTITGACFLGPGRLITLGRHMNRLVLETWRRHEDRLVSETEWRYESEPHHSQTHEIVPVPEFGEVMIRHGGSVMYLDGGTLAEVTDWRPLMGTDGLALWSKAGGGTYALGRWGAVEVADTSAAAVLALVDRPQTQLRPSDLAAVNRAAPFFGADREARLLEGLLRACLEHRFGSEVALGSAIASAGPVDIALSAGGDPPC